MTNRVVPVLLLLIGAAAIPRCGSAQTLRTLETGTRVRVRLESAERKVVAVVNEVRTDTLVLSRPNRTIESYLPFALSDIATLEISAGRRRLTPIGVIVGGLVGLGLTAGYNGIVQSQCAPSCPDRVPVGIAAAIGAVTFGVGFHFLYAERWVEIAVPRRRAGGM